MKLSRLDMQIKALESEEMLLKRELKNSIPTEYMTVKGRVKITVKSRLTTCQMELKQLKLKKEQEKK